VECALGNSRPTSTYDANRELDFFGAYKAGDRPVSPSGRFCVDFATFTGLSLAMLPDHQT